jgi:hypothetical protein
MPAVTTLQLGRNEVLNQVFHTVYDRLMAGEGWAATPESRVAEGSELSMSGEATVARVASVA